MEIVRRENDPEGFYWLVRVSEQGDIRDYKMHYLKNPRAESWSKTHKKAALRRLRQVGAPV